MRDATFPSDRDPDTVLARYREKGRPDDLAALFDAAAPELFRLALRLCPDAPTAEDVLQETFLVVIERADAWDPGRPAMPWLTGILKNTARMSRRQASRRPDPARLASPAAETDPALGLEDEEERRVVREAMERLPEPLRGAALLRWRYGLEPAEIAHVRGVPPGTVRSWLHRALKSLRAEVGALPALFLFFRPERGLDGVRAALLRRAAVRFGAIRPVAAASAAGSGLVLGGLLVGKKLLVACAAVIVLTTAGWFATRSVAVAQRETADARSVREDAAAAAPSQHRAPQRAAQTDAEAAADAAVASAVDPDLDVRGVVELADGTPVDGAVVEAVRDPWSRIAQWTGADGDRTELRGRTRSAADGTFRLRLRRAEVVSLRIAKDGLAEEEMADVQAGDEVRVVLAPGVRLDLTVRDEAGDAVPDLDLELGRTADRVARVLRRVRTDAGGHVAVDGLPALAQIWLAPTRLGPTDPRLLLLPAEAAARRDVVVHPGQPLRGRITDAETGRPVAGARVGVDTVLFGDVVSGADGTYSMVAVRPMGGVKSVHVLADGYARGVAQIGDLDAVLDVALHKGFRLRGRVLDVSGRPVEDARLWASASTLVGSEWHFSFGGVRSRADGSFEIPGLDRLVEHALAVEADGTGGARRSVAAPGPDREEVDLGDVVLRAAHSIEGTIRGADGAPLARREVVLTGPIAVADGEPGAESETRRSDHAGRFRFADLVSGIYRISAGVPGATEAALDVVVAPGEDLRGVVLRAGATRTVDVRVTDDLGAPVCGAIVTARTESGIAGTAVSGLDGLVHLTTTVDALEVGFAGAWERVAVGEFVGPPPVRVPAGGPAELTLPLRPAGALSGTVLDADGAPVAATWVRAVASDRTSRGVWTDASGGFRLLVPRDGRVDLVVDGRANAGGRTVDLLLQGRADAVAPGTAGLVIRCAPVETGRTLVVRVTDPDGAPVSGVGVDARCLANPQASTATTGADGRAELRGLTARAHVVGARGKDRWLPPRWTGDEVVPAGQEVTLVLRRSATIRGAVLTEDGRPAAGLSVTVGADEESGASAYGAKADERGEFVLLVPEEARGTFSIRASGVVAGAQVLGEAAGLRAGDAGVRVVVRK